MMLAHFRGMLLTLQCPLKTVYLIYMTDRYINLSRIRISDFTKKILCSSFNNCFKFLKAYTFTKTLVHMPYVLDITQMEYFASLLKKNLTVWSTFLKYLFEINNDFNWHFQYPVMFKS